MADNDFPEETPLRAEDVEEELKHWKIVRATNYERGQALVVRIRTEPPARCLQPAQFGIAVEVTWRYRSSTGFPQGETKEEIVTFERAIDDLSWHNGNSELLQVITGMGVKQWLLYVRDRDAFMTDFNRALRKQPTYPLEISFYPDPQWQIWRQTLADVDAKGE